MICLRIFRNGFRGNNMLSLCKSNFSHVIGEPFSKPINVSTSRFLKDITDQHASRIYINSYQQNQSLTYQQTLQKAQQLATGLIQTYNLKPKDRIGLYAYNKTEWIIIQYAAAIADLILVNINPNYQAEQLAYTIDKVGISVLFLNDQFKLLNYINVVRNLIPDLDNLNAYNINSSKFPTLKSVVRMTRSDDKVKGFVNLLDLYKPVKASLLTYNNDKDQAVNIQFTSGTTGRPKAATLSHFNILNNAYLIGNQCGYTSKDNIAVPVPFYHCFGMIMGTLAALVRAGQITIITQGFDPKKTLQAVCKYKSTSLYGVPTMFIQYLRIYDSNKSLYDLSTLRTGIVAGAMCSEVLINKIMNDLNIKDITNSYGMTETSPVSFHTSPSDAFHRKTTTVGKILPGLQAKIMDTDGKECSFGEPGQFWVKGWSVMLNYWGDENATKNSIENGWMKSGDLGIIDKQGYLSIVGRIKDMIIRGGQNIYPKELQEYLVKKEGVLDAQVVGVSDEKYGEQVAAVIKVKDLNDNPLTREHVVAFCDGKIANFKIPRYIKFVTDYPLTVSGKVQKFIIRKQLEVQKKSGKIKDYIASRKKAVSKS